jgi:hypothetical protein
MAAPRTRSGGLRTGRAPRLCARRSSQSPSCGAGRGRPHSQVPAGWQAPGHHVWVREGKRGAPKPGGAHMRPARPPCPGPPSCGRSGGDRRPAGSGQQERPVGAARPTCAWPARAPRGRCKAHPCLASSRGLRMGLQEGRPHPCPKPAERPDGGRSSLVVARRGDPTETLNPKTRKRL